MTRRSIGQDLFGFARREHAASSLNKLCTLINRYVPAALLDPFYPATKSEPTWPPLAMVKTLLLSIWHGIWYDLSDVKLVKALDDRASFHRFRRVPLMKQRLSALSLPGFASCWLHTSWTGPRLKL